MAHDDDPIGTQTWTSQRDMELDDPTLNLYRVVDIDMKGHRTILGRGLTRDEAQAWLRGKHPMPGKKIGVLPETRFDRKLLDES